jgi:arylsulfatase A-like enzyme
VPLGVSAEFKGRSEWGLYGDAIEEMDFHVGRIFDTLKRLGLDEKTLVIYASDNGRGPGRNASQPFRGSKLTTYEAGIRVPCIAWGPGVGVRARQSSAIIHAMDWFPTLATMAGVKVPDGRILDGRDLTPLLAGKSDGVPLAEAALSLNASVPLRRTWNPPGEWAPLVTRDDYINAFFYHGAEGQLAAVRSGQWKLTLNPMLQLFDLERDPAEEKPVRNPEITRKLRGMAVMFQEEMSSQRAR